jgi:uncharacterized protein YjgD (DUF1641 family)
MTDEMVSRLAETAAESVSLVDRLNRAGLDRIVGSLERLGVMLEGTMGALEAAKREVAAGPAAGGGLGGLWQLLRDPESQESLRYLLAFAKEFRKRGP